MGFYVEDRYSGIYAAIVFCFVLPDNYFARYGLIVDNKDVTLLSGEVYEQFQTVENGMVIVPALFELSGYFTELAYRFYGNKGGELYQKEGILTPSVFAFPHWKAGDSVNYYYYYITMDGVKVNTDVRTMVFKSNMSSTVKEYASALQRYEMGFPVTDSPLSIKIKPAWDEYS